MEEDTQPGGQEHVDFVKRLEFLRKRVADITTGLLEIDRYLSQTPKKLEEVAGWVEAGTITAQDSQEYVNREGDLRLRYVEIGLGNIIVKLQEIMVSGSEDMPWEMGGRKRDIPIAELELSKRTYGQLKRAGIDFIHQLEGISRGDLLGVRNIGPKSTDEVLEKYRRYKELYPEL
ncbi:MAG: DNA-directed RNA polymerase subunit alpha C-terminal domain-containing protein [bacterium]|nr:DNA-directed RNA polymerase subunit alpha C-terminal domain-containing protein [bacterium]